MQAPALLVTLNDRFFRAAALRMARARVNQEPDRQAAARQAVLLVEVARRVADPTRALPPGGRPALRLSLYRDAIYWALVAGRPAGEPVPTDLRMAWQWLPSLELGAAAREPMVLEAIAGALVEPAPSLDVTAGTADLVGAFAEALVFELDAPQRRVNAILGQRVARIAVSWVVLALLVYGVRVLSLGPDLAAGRAFRTSSSWMGCSSDPNCVGLAFHTEPQVDPWAELDLGRPTTFHRIEITNRGDCCAERAIPLVVEVSADGAAWREVARRDAEFSSWTVRLQPMTARYVKFKVPRMSTLHLQRVAIR
jgi:hypothetical protein